jgi:hypothetical protein
MFNGLSGLACGTAALGLAAEAGFPRIDYRISVLPLPDKVEQNSERRVNHGDPRTGQLKETSAWPITATAEHGILKW